MAHKNGDLRAPMLPIFCIKYIKISSNRRWSQWRTAPESFGNKFNRHEILFKNLMKKTLKEREGKLKKVCNFFGLGFKSLQ